HGARGPIEDHGNSQLSIDESNVPLLTGRVSVVPRPAFRVNYDRLPVWTDRCTHMETIAAPGVVSFKVAAY
ncbi:MAG: hypothetical protein Q9174_006202, partial [Haloplaca sp. 1 TL-2023]